MITIDDVKRVVADEIIPDYTSPPDAPPTEEEWSRWEYPPEEVATIFYLLGVQDRAERIKMFNISSFDLDDIVALANVEFSVIHCDMCKRAVFRVEPEDWSMFQGINTEGEIGPVDINGHEKQICDECYNNPIFY